MKRLEEVLRRLQAQGFRAKRKKCRFLQTSVEYLGHRVDAEGISPLSDKLEAIEKAPLPQNVHQLRSFLGLIGYPARTPKVAIKMGKVRMIVPDSFVPCAVVQLSVQSSPSCCQHQPQLFIKCTYVDKGENLSDIVINGAQDCLKEQFQILCQSGSFTKA